MMIPFLMGMMVEGPYWNRRSKVEVLKLFDFLQA